MIFFFSCETLRAGFSCLLRRVVEDLWSVQCVSVGQVLLYTVDFESDTVLLNHEYGRFWLTFWPLGVSSICANGRSHWLYTS